MGDVVVARGVLLPLPLVGFPARAQHNQSCSARISVRIHASTRNTSNALYNFCKMSDTCTTNSAHSTQARLPQSTCMWLGIICVCLFCARLTKWTVHCAVSPNVKEPLGHRWKECKFYELCKCMSCASCASCACRINGRLQQQRAKQGVQSLRPFQRKPLMLR